MEKTLQKIANLLIINLQNINSLGLLDGKMGVAIFLYYYARYSSQPVYNDQSDDLLDELFAALKEAIPNSLINGAAGIGFGLNYLIKNRFIETDENPDELFKEIDVRLPQDIGKQMISDMRSIFPVFSAGFYALSRIEVGKRTNQKNKLIISLLEIIYKFYNTRKEQKILPAFTNSVIYFLLIVYGHGIYPTKTKKTLMAVLSLVGDSMQSVKYNLMDIELLKSLLSSIPFDSKWIDIILDSINQKNLSSDNDSEIDVIPKNLQLFALYPNLDYPHISKIAEEKYIDDQINDSFFPDLPLLAYLGLAMMNVKLC